MTVLMTYDNVQNIACNDRYPVSYVSFIFKRVFGFREISPRLVIA